jgi:hypothetical protein
VTVKFLAVAFTCVATLRKRVRPVDHDGKSLNVSDNKTS